MRDSLEQIMNNSSKSQCALDGFISYVWGRAYCKSLILKLSRIQTFEIENPNLGCLGYLWLIDIALAQFHNNDPTICLQSSSMTHVQSLFPVGIMLE